MLTIYLHFKKQLDVFILLNYLLKSIHFISPRPDIDFKISENPTSCEGKIKNSFYFLSSCSELEIFFPNIPV